MVFIVASTVVISSKERKDTATSQASFNAPISLTELQRPTDHEIQEFI